MDWVNIISNQNYYDSLNVIGNGSSFQAKITLPSGCVGFSPVRTILSKAVVSNEVIKHASCNLNNGKIISTMVLGTAPFRYVWKNGLTIIRDTISYSVIDSIYDLATGNYSLDITDNYGNIVPTEPSCTGGPFSYVIDNIPPPAVSLSVTNISCFGMADGSITAAPNQGSAPYTYLWSNNATTEINSYLSAGTYSVTVTDNDGCSAEAQGTIIEPGVLNINLTYAEPLCTGASNGIAVSSIGGGTPPFVFEWFDNLFQSVGTNDDSLFNIPAGTYHLAVTDANFCNTSSTIVVDDPPLLTAVCNPTDATCFGGSDGSATVNANGGRGLYSYLWSTGATTTTVSSLPAGSYLVTVTDGNGCTAQCTAVIGEPAQVGGNVSGSDVACIDGQTSVIVTGTGGTAPYTGEGSFTVGVGTHNFPIVDLNGCTGTASITINHLDVDAPVISDCPADITQCESIVTWTAPTASDNCTVSSFVSNYNSGDSFPVGTTLITYTATDNAGLVNTCNFNITIVPTPVWYQDLDADGFGNALVSITSCNQPVGYIADNTDCDDAQLLYADLDGDTYGAGAPVACGVASNNDCNDAVAAINPGAAEVCNGIDDNCNGLTDDGLVFVTYYADADGGGFGNAASSVSTCDGAPVGYVVDNTDCDDAQLLYADLDGDTYGAGAPVACGVASNNDCNDAVAAINPGATEVCNLIDDDCDGNTDEGVQLTFYADADLDTYGDPLATVLACTAPVGYVTDNTDCDDTNPAVNPAAIEVCNLIDDDCDGSIDEGVQSPFYADTDLDTYGDPLVSVMACTAPLGYVADNTDCNDAVATINPGAAEVCNGIDDNCNGLTDDGLVFITYYADVDGDGFGNAASSVSTCDGAPAGYVVDNTDCDDALLLYADQDGDTYGAGAPVACGVASNTDCNDGNAAINPGAAEVCNGIDDNCNGLTDDGLVFVTYYADVDGDGFGNAASSVSTCDGAPAGYIVDNTDCDDAQVLYADLDNDTYGAGAPVACGVASNTDCNDAVAAINPGAAEVCNGIDDNCNGLTDDGLVFITYYADVDGDGFGNAASSVSTCDGAPVGYVVDNTDCDDAQLLYADLDGDTYGAGAPVACGVASNTDCNDNDLSINPAATEICGNFTDEDCDGFLNNGCTPYTFYADSDNDTYGDPLSSTVIFINIAPLGYVADNTDCNDNNSSVNPGATEICNLIDDDCDGSIDEGVQSPFYADTDSDTYGDPLVSVMACTAPLGYVADNTDCNDGVATINPGAVEVCNGIDDNCNGLTDDGLVFITYYADVDGDGFGNAASSVSTCDGAPAGYVADNTDCDDAQLLYADLDGDTYGAGAPVACGVASNTDCNDAVAAINPGAAEVCNGIDDNCNGLTDDGLVFITYYADVDGDGFGNAASSVSTCDGAPVGYVVDNTDCDDAQLLYADLDGDTYGAGAPVACGVASNTDCNDAVAAINPGAAEICNGIDDNCNGLTDDGLVFITYYADVDGDGFGNAASSVSTCDGEPVGYVADNTDCDDAQLLYADLDGDTYGAGAPVACGVASNTDCNDGVATINPGAAEACNGIDDNCNGLTDDGLVFITYYADVDGDGFGNAASSVSTCDGAPVGYVVDNTDCDDAQLLYADLDGDTYGAGAPVACGVASNTDCNDAVAAINPGAAEVCNGIDDNCNGLTDDGLVFITYYADVDGDGFGNAASSVSTCDGAPAGYVVDNTDCDDAQLLYADLDNDTYGAGAPVACGVASNTDCNDAVAAINPGAAEVCNGIDDNCNGLTDDGLVFITYYADVDGDGFGNAASSVSTCDGAPAGYVADNTDCDDAQLLYADLDGDTYGAGAPVACGVASNTDCNDGVAAINPGAAEVCNGIDDNCNGLTDDGLVFITYYADVDGDGFGNAASSVSTCDGAPAGYVADNTDCDDAQLLYADVDGDTYGAGAPVACGGLLILIVTMRWLPSTPVLLKYVTVSMITVTV
ncbi:MAG: HYR domain-containing protein [Bacteroidetes bacterium]|nr:HYR domain-containing protein [Bacteroidota bacterium]